MLYFLLPLPSSPLNSVPLNLHLSNVASVVRVEERYEFKSPGSSPSLMRAGAGQPDPVDLDKQASLLSRLQQGLWWAPCLARGDSEA